MYLCVLIYTMKTTEIIRSKLDRLPMGHVVGYLDFIQDGSQSEAAVKALNRLVATGKLAKLSKGKYYKPENTPFGILQPVQSQVLKDLLEEKGKPIGYLTGYSVYNRLGLTTQVSNTIQIGKNQVRPSFKRGAYTVAFVKQRNTITNGNIPLLQLLDAIRSIKKIPDTTVEASCRRLLVLIDELTTKDIRNLVRLALRYPPATRALLGALLDQLQQVDATAALSNALNPITTYTFIGAANVLANAKKWNIK